MIPSSFTKNCSFVRAGGGDDEVSEHMFLLFIYFFCSFSSEKKNKTYSRKLMHLEAIFCHYLKCPLTLYYHCIWNPLCREFYPRLQKASGSCVELDLPYGQSLEGCDNSIFCWTAECMLLNVKHFHKQLEKWSPRKSCLLPYRLLSFTETTLTMWSEY